MNHDDLGGAPAQRGFTFTITNGEVTAVGTAHGSHTVTLPLPRDATFTVGAASITETLTGANATTVVTYVPEAANAALYEISSIKTTVTTPSTTTPSGRTSGYSFTLTDGVVTAEQRVFGSSANPETRTVHTPPDATYTVDGATITQTYVSGSAVETITFVKTSGGLYAVGSTSTTYVDPGSATTLLSVDSTDRLSFTIDSSGAVTAASRVGASGATQALPAHSHVTFTQLAPGFVEAVETFGSHSTYEVFYAGSAANGVYTEIAHGAGSTVDLVGLQAQLAQLPTANASLL